MEGEGVVASAVEIVSVGEVAALLESGTDVFSVAERRFAFATSDPSRRLAARLAAKRAACRLLAGDVSPSDVEVVRSAGEAPRLLLSPRASEAMARVGAARCLVSLTHEREHAAASVVLLIA
jgi:holo-[acyl-carrier protein] synthase